MINLLGTTFLLVQHMVPSGQRLFQGRPCSLEQNNAESHCARMSWNPENVVPYFCVLFIYSFNLGLWMQRRTVFKNKLQTVYDSVLSKRTAMKHTTWPHSLLTGSN